jgi:uncharacterized membrane protein YkvA (DUF1232 family)
MLTAFKEELKRLAVDPNDPFHQKIRQRVGKRATLILEKRLKQLILMMPGLVKRIHAHWEQSTEGSEIKRLGGFVFTYLYNPNDFLPEGVHGLFGYLDDAYLVVIIYEKVIRVPGAAGISVNEDDIYYLKQIQSSKKYVKAVIPKEVMKIEAMVDKAIKNAAFDDFAEALKAV